MTFIDRFKKRKTLSTVLNVPFPNSQEEIKGEDGTILQPKKEPYLIFQIERFSQQELNGAIFRARKACAGAIDKDSLTLVTNLEFFELLRSKVKGWQDLQGQFPFNAENLNALAEMEYVEAVDLVLAWEKADKLDRAEKKTT